MVNIVLVGIALPELTFSDSGLGQFNKTITQSTAYAHQAIADIGCDILVIPSASRAMNDQEVSIENTVSFLDTLRSENKFPAVVIVILESDNLTGMFHLAYQINGRIYEFRRQDVDAAPEVLIEAILKHMR